MLRLGTIGFAGVLAVFVLTGAATQELIDRIAVRVENDIILVSQVRALERYQQLVDGKSESDSQVLDRLIDQWIVRNEADAAQFARPSDADIDRGVERVEKSFSSPEEYEERRKQTGLSAAEVRGLVAAQMYLTNYLDSRFRPSAQVSSKEIDDFYQKAVVPRAQARGQAPPSLEAAHDYIREALVQRSINEQADRWLSESRSRVRVEKLLNEGAK